MSTVPPPLARCRIGTLSVSHAVTFTSCSTDPPAPRTTASDCDSHNRSTSPPVPSSAASTSASSSARFSAAVGRVRSSKRIGWALGGGRRDRVVLRRIHLLRQWGFAVPRRKTERLGEVTAPSGALFVVDMGLLEMWCHDRPVVMPLGVLDPEATEDVNAGCDFRIDGPDAEKCGRHWDRHWHPRFHFDIPRHGIDVVRKSFETFIAEHGYNAKLTRLRAKVTHRQRIADALEHGNGMGQVFFQALEGFVISGIPTDTPMRVVGERRGGRDSAVKDRWRWVDLE